ncbi:hypothetical protein M885DRAFT_549064 [Pelagophyceae sp. CCMP2097]|nr:hypothetical protein M885DRAFT_549064 [Pelagophyceae sp. CCMP2097]
MAEEPGLHVVDLQRTADVLVASMVSNFKGLVQSARVAHEDTNQDSAVPLHAANLVQNADDVLNLIHTLRRNLTLADLPAIDAQIDDTLKRPPDKADAPKG